MTDPGFQLHFFFNSNITITKLCLIFILAEYQKRFERMYNRNADSDNKITQIEITKTNLMDTQQFQKN